MYSSTMYSLLRCPDREGKGVRRCFPDKQESNGHKDVREFGVENGEQNYRLSKYMYSEQGR